SCVYEWFPARLVARRSRAAVRGDGARDESGVERPQCFRREAEARHCARPQVLDEHIGSADELSGLGAIIGLREIERDRLLAAVPGGEARRISTIWIAARSLDLDDVRALIGEECRRKR